MEEVQLFRTLQRHSKDNGPTPRGRRRGDRRPRAVIQPAPLFPPALVEIQSPHIRDTHGLFRLPPHATAHYSLKLRDFAKSAPVHHTMAVGADYGQIIERRHRVSGMCQPCYVMTFDESLADYPISLSKVE